MENNISRMGFLYISGQHECRERPSQMQKANQLVGQSFGMLGLYRV